MAARCSRTTQAAIQAAESDHHVHQSAAGTGRRRFMSTTATRRRSSRVIAGAAERRTSGQLASEDIAPVSVREIRRHSSVVWYDDTKQILRLKDCGNAGKSTSSAWRPCFATRIRRRFNRRLARIFRRGSRSIQTRRS